MGLQPRRSSAYSVAVVVFDQSDRVLPVPRGRCDLRRIYNLQMGGQADEVSDISHVRKKKKEST